MNSEEFKIKRNILLDSIESLRDQLLDELTKPVNNKENDKDKKKRWEKIRDMKGILKEKEQCWELIKTANEQTAWDR